MSYFHFETHYGTYPEADLVLLYRATSRERRGRIWVLPVEEFLKNLNPTRKLTVG